MKKILLGMIIVLGIVSCTKQQNSNNIEGVWLDGSDNEWLFEDGVVTNYTSKDTVQTYTVQRETITLYRTDGSIDSECTIVELTDDKFSFYIEYGHTQSDVITFIKVKDI